MFGWRMWTIFLVALLLPLCSAAPLEADENTEMAANADHDKDGNHAAHNQRGGKMFSHNRFDLGNIEVPGSVAGDDISIGHQVKIDVHGHGHGHDNLHGHARTHDHDIHIEYKELLRLLFKTIDANKDGLMDAQELIEVCQENNIHVTEIEATRILTLPDRTVGFNMAKFSELLEFCPSSNTAYMVHFLLHASGSVDHDEFDKHLKHVFLALDTDHDCKLHIPDLMAVFSDMGIEITFDDAKTLLAIKNNPVGVDFEKWKQLILKEVFKTKDLLLNWRKVFSKVEESLQEVGSVMRTEDKGVQVAAKTAVVTLALGIELGECYVVDLLKVESASVKVKKGLEYELMLRLATMGGGDCKDKIIKVCENIVVFKPLPEDCDGIDSLKLLNRDKITCNNVCASSDTNSVDCFCESENGDSGEACSANQGCTPDGTCLDVCDPGPYDLQADCFCKNTEGGGEPCAAESICEDGVCITYVVSNAPCGFSDALLTPPKMVNGRMSSYDTRGVFKWDKIVKYYYSEDSTTHAWDEDKQIIRGVMEIIEDKTCFEFKEGTKEELEGKEHCVEIRIDNNYCSGSPSGFVDIVTDNVDRLEFGLTSHPTKHVRSTFKPSYDDEGNPEDCNSRGLILHELMHVLGVGHTQTRSDREEYIKVDYIALQEKYTEDQYTYAKTQYDMCDPNTCTLFDSIPYECESIMHYGKGNDWGMDNLIIIPVDESTCELPRKNKCMQSLADKDYATDNDWDLLNIIGKCNVCSTGQVSAVCWCKEEGELCAAGQTCTADGTCTGSGKKRKRSTHTVTVRGKILLPEDSDFTFPTNSHVHVSCDNILNLSSSNLGRAVVDVSNKPSKDISYKMEFQIPNSGQMSLSATINMGWNRDPNSKERIRRGDFHNDVSHHLSRVEDNVEYMKDIAVVVYN